jgi:ribonuclease HI
MCGSERETTNNRMELMGLIRGLEALRSPEGLVKIYSDSVYVLRGASQWIHGWKKKGWRTAGGSEVLNRELWEELDRLLKSRKGGFEWHHLKGHSGIPANERCDQPAVSASLGEHPELYVGEVEGYGVDLTDIPADTSLPPLKSYGAKAAAPYAYLSNIGGLVVRHSNWAKCESRVKGRSQAKYKKVMSADEEADLLETWGVRAEEVKED